MSCRFWFVCVFSLACCLLFACESKEEDPTVDGGTTNPCGTGLKPYKTTCVPALDACKDGEVSLSGGGCKAIGLVECSVGVKLPGAATCTRVGQPATCPTGWSKVTGGWCEPVYDSTKCAAGYKPVLGKTSCQEIRACGSSTWGNIKTSSNTIFVDASNNGTGEGTQAKPYQTITVAMKYTKAGGHIALAAGTYNEDIYLTKAITIEGRCPQMVTIKQYDSYSYGAMDVSTKGVVIKGVSVTASRTGIFVSDYASAVVEDVVVSGCGETGVYVGAQAQLTLKNSLLQGNHETGFTLFTGKANISHTAILDSLPLKSSGVKGWGIQSWCTSTTDSAQGLTISDSLVRGNTDAGLLLNTTQVAITRTVVADTKMKADKTGGAGIVSQPGQNMKGGSVLTLTDVLLAKNRVGGLMLQGSSATAERLVVRDTQESASDLTGGQGIVAEVDHGPLNPSRLVLKDSALLRNKQSGLSVINSDCEVERTLIVDTLPRVSDKNGGVGISTNTAKKPRLSRGAKLTIKDSIIARNHDIGISLVSARATLERVLIKETRGGKDTMPWGIVETGEGILAFATKENTWKSETTITDSLIKNNRVNGIRTLAASATLTRTIIQDTQPTLESKLTGYGMQVGFDEQGQPSEVNLVQCVIQGNHDAGVLVVGSKFSAKGTAIRNTKAEVKNQDGGFGVVVMSPAGEGQRASLKLEDCYLTGNHEVSIVVNESDAIVHRSVIAATAKQKAGGVFGDGIQVFNKTGKLTMTNSWVDRSDRTGVLFSGSSGSVSGSTFTNGAFSIALESSASPTLSDDNLFDQNKRDSVAFSLGQKTAPLPPVPKYK